MPSPPPCLYDPLATFEQFKTYVQRGFLHPVQIARRHTGQRVQRHHLGIRSGSVVALRSPEPTLRAYGGGYNTLV